MNTHYRNTKLGKNWKQSICLISEWLNYEGNYEALKNHGCKDTDSILWNNTYNTLAKI